MILRSDIWCLPLSIATGLIASILFVDSVRAETWSDTTGKFKLEAKYAGIDGKSVVLLKSDGKTINVPIANLSPESRAQAKALYEKSKTTAPLSPNAVPAKSTTNATQIAYKPKTRELKFTPPTVPTISPMPAFPENASLQETLDHVRDQVMAGHLEVFWAAMPDDLRVTVDSNEIRDGLRPYMNDNMKMSNEVVEVIDKLSEVLITKKPFILKSPMVAQAPPMAMPLIEKGYDPAVGFIYEYSELACNGDAIANTSVSNFLNFHLPRIGAHFQALLKVVPAELRDPFINGIVVKQTDDSTGTISWPKQDGTMESKDMVRYNNRWLPKEFAEKWQADKDTIIQKMIATASSGVADPQSNPQSKAMIDAMVKQASAMLDPLIAAKSQQEFDLATNQLMMPLMMMFGGAGGPGAAMPGGPGAPAAPF